MSSETFDILQGKISVLFKRDAPKIAEVLNLLNKHERLELLRKFDIGESDQEWNTLQQETELKVDAINSLLLVLNNKPIFQGSKLQDKRDLLKELYHLAFELNCTYFDSLIDASIDKAESLVLLALNGVSADRVTEVAIWIENNADLLQDVPARDTKTELKLKTYDLLLHLLGKLHNAERLHALDEAMTKAEDCLARFQKDEMTKDRISLEDGFFVGVFANLIYTARSVKTYLLNGSKNQPENVYSLIQTYLYNANTLSSNLEYKRLHTIIKHCKNAFDQLCDNSIWSVASRSPLIQKFFENNILSQENMILTLLPSQRNSILEVLSTRKSIVVNMPTSAGKSLLAELYILFTIQNQTFGDFKPTIGYIVPTNALINQVRTKLKKVFLDFDFKIESVLPFYETDSMEEEILKQYGHIDVLITTPEKMDFMVRNDNPAIKNLKLVILDEAHNIANESRGAKFELLLSIIKQKRADVNFLLLSPFIGNSNMIAEWLGDTVQNSTAITIDWSPTKQYVGCNLLNTAKTESEIVYFPSARNSIVEEQLKIPLNVNPQYIKEKIGAKTINSEVKNIALLEKYIGLGDTTLVLCNGPNSAQKIAGTALRYFKEKGMLNDISDMPEIQNTLTIIKYESQQDDPLIDCLKHGVAYHHAQLNGIVKEEVEKLSASGVIKLLFATTTLAQGMNFPITTVIFDTLKLGGGANAIDMDSTTFWNIAGRAGRAYMDKEGHVIVGYRNTRKATKEITLKYIKHDLEKIVSSLSDFFRNIEGHIEFNYQLIKQKPAISNFLQYLNHIVKVTHKYNLDNIDTNRIRSILNTSLFYKEGEFEQGFIETQRKINDFALSYVDYLKGESKTQLTLADLFGVSNISLNVVTAAIIEHKGEIESYYPENERDNHFLASKVVLESRNVESMAKIVDIIAKLPEMKISIWNRPGKLDSESIAKVIIGWVSGESVQNIAKGIRKEHETEDRVRGLCNQYINGSLKNFIPWGINIYQVITGDDRTDEAKMLPSYIYYGVHDKESVILSKIGVPRFLVPSIKGALKQNFANEPISTDNIEVVRGRIKELQHYEFGESEEENTKLKSIVMSYI